jgi:hypothetical protein
MQLQALFRKRDVFTTTLMTYMTAAYKTDFIEWDPATVAMQLKADLHIDVPGYNLDKIQAGCSLFTSNLFHVSIETFLPVCLTMSRGVAITTSLVPANLHDLAWGLSEARLLEGTDFDADGFSHNIALYTGIILDQEGLYEPPKVFEFAEYPKGRKEAAYNAIAATPDDYQLYYEMQQQKRDEINTGIQQRLLALFNEIRTLPLGNLNGAYLENIIGKLKAAGV